MSFFVVIILLAALIVGLVLTRGKDSLPYSFALIQATTFTNACNQIGDAITAYSSEAILLPGIVLYADAQGEVLLIPPTAETWYYYESTRFQVVDGIVQPSVACEPSPP